MYSSWTGMLNPNIYFGGIFMENNKNFNEEKFDSFLNKTIIFSSKEYYRNEISKDVKELKIIDDENYEEFIKEYIKCDEDIYNLIQVDSFVDLCTNTMLIRALKSLSNIEMMVIFLLFEKELTSAEASKILEICSDSVTRIKRRALKKLEDYLKGDNKNE